MRRHSYKVKVDSMCFYLRHSCELKYSTSSKCLRVAGTHRAKRRATAAGSRRGGRTGPSGGTTTHSHIRFCSYYLEPNTHSIEESSEYYQLFMNCNVTCTVKYSGCLGRINMNDPWIKPTLRICFTFCLNTLYCPWCCSNGGLPHD